MGQNHLTPNIFVAWGIYNTGSFSLYISIKNINIKINLSVYYFTKQVADNSIYCHSDIRLQGCDNFLYNCDRFTMSRGMEKLKVFVICVHELADCQGKQHWHLQTK